MSETKWTKGPFTAEAILRGDGTPAGGWSIYGGPVGGLWIGDAVNKDIAALFAAAPDLAEALRVASDMLSAVAGDIEDGLSPGDLRFKYVAILVAARDNARAALARAKGAS